jgi:hypothetical protein
MRHALHLRRMQSELGLDIAKLIERMSGVERIQQANLM